MAIPILSDEQIRNALKELEQAKYNHEQWTETLYGTLICRLTADERDIAPDAFRRCRFGQWYYKSGGAAFGDFPGFAEIGVEHERMHQHAATLLRSTAKGVPVSIQDYERFQTALKRMRLEIATVQHDLEGTLFNLDPLTGTPSRIGMLSKLREQQEFVRRNHACAVAMMDLDRFKLINDEFGHSAGDKVLVAVAHYVMAHLRPYDRVFRYGGDEFLLCLPDTSLEEGRVIVERLRQELGLLRHEAEGKGVFHVTVSFGVTALDGNLPVEQSIDGADKALYAAKETGRNRVVVLGVSSPEAPAEVHKAPSVVPR